MSSRKQSSKKIMSKYQGHGNPAYVIEAVQFFFHGEKLPMVSYSSSAATAHVLGAIGYKIELEEGDWITPQGEHYRTIKPDIFALAYIPLEENNATS